MKTKEQIILGYIEDYKHQIEMCDYENKRATYRLNNESEKWDTDALKEIKSTSFTYRHLYMQFVKKLETLL